MAHPNRALPTILLTVLLTGTPASPAPARQEEQAPEPFIEREEVRFVTLDIVAEEKDRGWRPLRDLAIEQIEVRVGGRLMSVDQFEDHCRSVPAVGAMPGSDAPGPPPEPSGESSPADPGIDTVGPTTSVRGDRYILYFDMEHLSLAGRDAAFKAARSWATDRLAASDEVMIITAGRGLRIVRDFLPSDDHLLQDLELAENDFRATELWGAMESMRQWELNFERNASVRRSLAISYMEIDRSKTRHSLENMRDLMTIFDAVDGTKNLVLFADTIRLIPGRQYGITSNPPIDVHTQLQGVAEAANERNVRIYPVKAGLWVPGGGGEPLADDAMTMLASETGGSVFEGSNVVDGAFELIGDDLACYYRIGFRIRPRYSGKIEPIRVRILDRSRSVRLRYRQTLDDPTREVLDADMIRAAFMAPSTAGAFPIAVRAKELFRQAGGARLQVEVGTSLGAMLGLPVPGRRQGARQVRLEIGARVVPLRPLEESAGTASPRRGAWADAATDLSSAGFGRQAVLTLPPGSTSNRGFDRVVAAGEFDVPPGRYRIVAVIQDQLARTVSATTIDAPVESDDPPRLGPVGLASGDSHAIVLQDRPAESDDRKGAPDDRSGSHASDRDASISSAPDWDGKEVKFASPLLPPGALLTGVSVIEAGNPAHLFYAICPDAARRGDRSRRSADSPAGEWTIERLLTCGSEQTTFRLPPRSLPEEVGQHRCVTMLDSIAADDLPEGRCRFEVRLTTPDRGAESSVREFSVVPSTGHGTTAIGARLTAPGGSHTCPI